MKSNGSNLKAITQQRSELGREERCKTVSPDSGNGLKSIMNHFGEVVHIEDIGLIAHAIAVPNGAFLFCFQGFGLERCIPCPRPTAY